MHDDPHVDELLVVLLDLLASARRLALHVASRRSAEHTGDLERVANACDELCAAETRVALHRVRASATRNIGSANPDRHGQ